MLGTLAGAGSAGVSAVGGTGMTSGSTGGVFGGGVTGVGRIVLIVAMLIGRGDRGGGWVAGCVCSSGRPAAWTAGSRELSDS